MALDFSDPVLQQSLAEKAAAEILSEMDRKFFEAIWEEIDFQYQKNAHSENCIRLWKFRHNRYLDQINAKSKPGFIFCEKIKPCFAKK